jgi:thiol-disulfide isomerase/thioredoxin
MSSRIKIIVGILALLLLGGGVYAFMQNSSDMDANSSMEKTDDVAMKQDESMEKSEDEAMEKTDETMTKKSGSYVSLADFDANPAQYEGTTKVYFFHASWCPICQAINAEIEADPSQIGDNITLIKTDFDTSTSLRQKYGVTTQYTFVQVDESGNEIKQWTASNLGDALAGVEV